MSEAGPIRVFPRDGRWLVDYGSYVCAFLATRNQAVAVGAEAARDEQRALVIEEADLAGSVLPRLNAVGDEPDFGDVAQMDGVAFSEYVNERLAAVTSQMLANFLEGFEPDTATGEDLARRTLLLDLTRAERDRHVPLTEHEEAQLDRMISAQPPQLRDMYRAVRNTSARHVLYMLRGLETI